MKRRKFLKGSSVIAILPYCNFITPPEDKVVAKLYSNNLVVAQTTKYDRYKNSFGEMLKIRFDKEDLPTERYIIDKSEITFNGISYWMKDYRSPDGKPLVVLTSWTIEYYIQVSVDRFKRTKTPSLST